MIVKKYKSVVSAILNSVPGVYTIDLKSLDGSYKYMPGQFLHLALDSDYDGVGQWPESRCFSMQSNPNEENVRITYAVKGRFTKTMEQLLKIGTEVWLKLPYGDLFTKPHNKINTVFIAGGTGITPFLSLFSHKSFNEYINPRIYLGFKSKEHNIYKKELEHLWNSSVRVKFYYEEKDGIINILDISKKNSNASVYFISGPPVMIKKFKQVLISNNVPSNQILTDDWE
jgi:predicted ferric reductase